MLTNPNATYTNPVTGGTSPVSPNAWYMFGKQVDCEAIMSVFQKQNPAAKVRLIDEIASGQAFFYSKPDPNPDGISIWHLLGAVPGPNDAQGNPTTLQIDEYAGWLFDRGNAPGLRREAHSIRHQWSGRRNRRAVLDLLGYRQRLGSTAVVRDAEPSFDRSCGRLTSKTTQRPKPGRLSRKRGFPGFF